MIIADRKSAILSRPTLPCLKDYHAVNLTAGCPLGCKYCYTQGYANNPGNGRIKFYSNSEERLAEEIRRMRRKPKKVYFSTATDPFLPVAKVLDMQFRVMEMLLKNGISILVLTKAKIPDRFLDLFAEHRDRVEAQIGQTTTDETVRKAIEPNTATAEERLWNISKLIKKGVRTQLRMDPLIPRLTDTEESLRALLHEVSARGCREVAASFLHIRPSHRKPMSITVGSWNFEQVFRDLYTKPARLANGDAAILLPNESYRRERIGVIKRISESLGLSAGFCGCKNPDLGLSQCHPDVMGAGDQVTFDF
ncbi:MAG: radical SAM protein [Deltaproteobacteria bacterium]|nr:radical SAM protein [Deltaproteobacteria bacterium]MCB9488768.1 radical SAM protein [Deltaproteobacteria bacterium]